MSENTYIHLERQPDGIATLVLNRPEKYNAFIPEMLDQWLTALDVVERDPTIKVMVLTGAGKAFCAGGDSSAMSKRAEKTAIEQKDFLWRKVHLIALKMQQLDKPTIAAINGTARGAGLDMALMCDLRYAGASVTVAESYIHVGLVAGDGGAWYLSRLVRPDIAFDICLTGRNVGAEEAATIGLVTSCVPDADLMSTVYEKARVLASQPQHAIKIYKRMLVQAPNVSLEVHLDMASSHTAVLRDTDEHREKIAALANKKR